MKYNLVITAFGPDHPGIVSKISTIITKHGGNVEESRMTNLGNDFAIILLATIQRDWLDSLKESLKKINDLTIYTKLTKNKEKIMGLECIFDLVGADHEGILSGFSEYLSNQSINIDEMITNTTHAPSTGTTLFNMKAYLTIPLNLEFDKVKYE